MITKLTITLGMPQPQLFRIDWGYALYGALCEMVPQDVVENWHAQGMTPLRQNVIPGPQAGQCTWTIMLFDDEAPTVINAIGNLSEIDLDKAESPLQVLDVSIDRDVSAAQLMKLAGEQPQGSRVKITFKTPTGFKTDGQYALYPTAELIAKSLLQSWNNLMPECSLSDEEAERMLLQGLRITQYQLQSAVYRLKGQGIYGFTGSVIIKANLAAPIMEMWRLLLAFAPYSGIGMKTTLGMGAVRIRVLPE